MNDSEQRDKQHWIKPLIKMVRAYMTTTPDMCYELEGKTFEFGPKNRLTTIKQDIPQRMKKTIDAVLIKGFYEDPNNRSDTEDKMIVKRPDGNYEVWVKCGTYHNLAHACEEVMW